MAGMLPGVEAARRRRFHQKSNQCYGASEPSPAASGHGGTCSTRRPSFCLYVSSHDFQLCSSTSSTIQRSHTHTVCDESKLGAEAREAKKRLDERLFHPQWRSETSRGKGREEEKEQKSGSKRLSWLKMRWRRRWREEEECVVCLEEIKADTLSLMQLGCGHRFHTHCLLPWLHANNHCPCCRMQIPIPLPLPLPLPLPIM